MTAPNVQPACSEIIKALMTEKADWESEGEFFTYKTCLRTGTGCHGQPAQGIVNRYLMNVVSLNFKIDISTIQC